MKISNENIKYLCLNCSLWFEFDRKFEGVINGCPFCKNERIKEIEIIIKNN